MRNAHASFVLLSALLAVCAGCGGGGGISSTVGSGSLPAQPAPLPTATLSPGAQTFTLQSQSATIALPPVGSFSGTILMPPGSGSVAIVSGLAPPVGIPLPIGIAPVMYVSFYALGGPALMNQMPGFSLSLPTGMMGAHSYYMAQYRNGAWSTVEGPGTMNGAFMMMNPPPVPVSLQTGQITCFAYYSGSPLP